MSVACVLVAHFPLKTELRRKPQLRGKPVVIAKTIGGDDEVVDFSPSLRLHKGMPLTEALAMAGNVQVLEADPAYYRRAFRRVLDRLLQHSPIVEGVDLDHAYVGLQGLELLYGSHAQLVAKLRRVLPEAWGTRVGTGPNKFVAYLAALTASPGAIYDAPKDAERFVQGFSVTHLPLDRTIRRRLYLFNLATLKDIAAIGIGPLQAEFGPIGKAIWELSHGVDTRAVTPVKEEQYVTEHLTFPFAASSIETLLRSTEILLRRAFNRPDMRGKFAGRATVHCTLAQAPAWSRAFHFREGIKDASRALAVMKGRLEADMPPDAFERVSITLSHFTGEPSTRSGLFDVHDRLKQRTEIAEGLRRRTQGNSALFKVVELQPNHPLPEMRAVLMPVDAAAADQVKLLRVPEPVEVMAE